VPGTTNVFRPGLESQRPYNPGVSRDSDSPTREGGSSAPRQTGDRPLKSGTLLGERYRIDSVLGYGGMGVVYRARDVKLDQDIALKRIRPDRMSPERQQTLRREIILSRRVTHENVCRVYDLVELNGEEFVSMEFVPGRTLKDIETEERTLPLGRGLAIAKKICRGLAAAHRIGILHRDLKPENVIVSDDGTPRLMDFGIAVETDVSRGEKEDMVPGTPQFLAPELLRGEAPSILSDVYAMGVVLFEMFTGRVPFDDADGARLVRRIIAEAPPKAATFRPDLPPDLLSILDRSIAKDPASRFTDADALADTIAAFEGEVLDRVLAEVSVTRAKMVKLMVILEANKSLAATFDPSETLRIILRTATSETDAERGTIFLREPGSDTIVSQILEGGAVARIVLPLGRGIAGTVAQTGEIINISDAYEDARFDSETDAASGFQTRSILAAPLRTPRGEIVGVVELLNKRSRAFTREDEEFLSEVGTHAALAVENVRQHEAAVTQAHRQGAAAAMRSVRALFEPASWPATPGFESAPLCWEAEEGDLAGYAVEASPGFLGLLLVESTGSLEQQIGPLASALAAGRALLAATAPADIVASVQRGSPSASITAARWEGSRLRVAAARAPLPLLFREGRAVRPDAVGNGARLTAECETASGDLLVAASSGLDRLRFDGEWRAPEQILEELAQAATARPLPAAFANAVSVWKNAGISTGTANLLLLAARRT
jgi:serine/threonine protein kinase/putative methionine-R-sulfoxide reductase with GAF domain